MTDSDSVTDELLSDLWNARHGDPRFGHEDFGPFPSLIARADETGDDELRFLARLEGAYAAMWAGRTSDVLTLMVWLLRERDRHGPDLELADWKIRQFETTFVSLISSLTGLPELALDQVLALTDDWVRRVRGTEFYAPVVEATVRADVALHRGDSSEAVRILDACADFSPPAGTCGAGARATLAGMYSAAGAFDRALSLSTPDLTGDPSDRCGFYPAETYEALLLAWSHTGRRDDVLKAAPIVVETYGPISVESITIAIEALLRVDALAEALPLAVANAGDEVGAANPLEEAMLWAAVSAALASAALADPDAVVTIRGTDGTASTIPAMERAAVLADRVRVIGQRFDVRNASDAVSTGLEEVMALRASGGDVPAGLRVKPVAQRSAEELFSGISAFGQMSPRRSAQCADLLRGRLDELSERERIRAGHLLAWDSRRADPAEAVVALRAAADRTRADYPAWSAQSDLLAAVLEADGGAPTAETLLNWPAADTAWSGGSRVNLARLHAMATAPIDPSVALRSADEGLAILDRIDRGETTFRDPRDRDAADGAAEADVAGQRAALHLVRASLLASLDGDGSGDVDAALVAARQAVRLSNTPDQLLAQQSELVGALRTAADDQGNSDLRSALLLLDEAERSARHELLGEVLSQRAHLHLVLGDADSARDDAERAVAVLTVEGDEVGADAARFDLGQVMLSRGEDPLAVIELLAPVVEGMRVRSDVAGEAHGLRILAEAQSAAGRADDAVTSHTRVLDLYEGIVPVGLVAYIRSERARELSNLGRFPEALADLEAAHDGFVAAQAQQEAADVLRNAALTAHFAGDSPRSRDFLDRAYRAYDELATSTPVDFERARLDFARADIMSGSDPTGAAELMAEVADRARAANWVNLLVPVLHLSALLARDRGDVPTARDMVSEALRYAPEHPALLELADEFA